MEDDSNIIELFKYESGELENLLKNVSELNPEECLFFGMKDEEIFIGSINFPSRVKLIGALSYLQNYLYETKGK